MKKPKVDPVDKAASALLALFPDETKLVVYRRDPMPPLVLVKSTQIEIEEQSNE